MTDNNFLELTEIFSVARLNAYKLPGENDIQAFTRYQQNIQMSEALFPALNYLEIILRNRLDKAIRLLYGSDWLIQLPHNLPLDDTNYAKLQSAKTFHQYEKRCTPSHNDLVAHMTFGFWANFFHKRYDPILWQRKQFTVTVFPHLERHIRSRHAIKPKLQTIKEMRNRIAHHEPIWNWHPGADISHNFCLELIGYMSKDALIQLKQIDRFPAFFIQT